MAPARWQDWDDLVSTSWLLAEEIRWGTDGLRCPRCKSGDPYLLMPRKVYKCKKCKKQYTPLSGTILAAMKIPFSSIVYAIERIVVDDSFPADIQRELMVNYRTAHAICRKTREVMNVMETVEGTDLLDAAERAMWVIRFMLQSPDYDKDFFQKRIGRRHSDLTVWAWSGHADTRRRNAGRHALAEHEGEG